MAIKTTTDELDTNIFIDEYGIVYHIMDNELHRTNGPAIEWPDGTQEWWVDGKRHRSDGPAFISACGTEVLWYLNGVEVDQITHFVLRPEPTPNPNKVSNNGI